MKHIKTRFDKHDIPDLPKAEFEGRIITVVSPGEAERAVSYLLSQPILGLDTETRPSFQPGRGMNKVALLQVSTPDTCFLFRLCQMGMPPCIIRLLEDTTVIKVGLSWHDDLMQLRRRCDFQPGSYVELQELVTILGVKDLSLAKIFANLFGRRISKTQRLTNWEADVLTHGQKVYAATDAWACIEIYNEISRLHQTQDFLLEIVPEPEPPQPAPKADGPEPAKKSEKSGSRSKRGAKKSEKTSTQTGNSGKEGKKRKPRRKSVMKAPDEQPQAALAGASAEPAKPKRRKHKRKPQKLESNENTIS